MSDFYQKVRTIVPTTSIVPRDTYPAHPTTNITMVGGQNLSVPSFQVPTKNPYRNSNIWRYPAAGSYTGFLTTGGQVQVPVIRGSGSGHVEEVWLRIVCVNNTAGPLEYLPAPLWINNHVWQTPSGATIQQQTGTHLWFNLVGEFHQEDWQMVSQAVNSSLDYETGDPIPAGATVTFYIPLVGNFMSASNFFIPAVSGDLQYYVNFWPDANIRTAGAAPSGPIPYPLSISQISLDIKMEQMAPPELQATIAKFASQRMDYIIPYYKNQPQSLAVTPAATNLVNLSNISGDVIWADFCIRDSYIGNDLINYEEIGSFQYQNQEGVGISSQQYIDDRFSRDIIYPRQNKGTFTRNHPVYRHIFANSDMAAQLMLEQALKLGAYPFDNHNNLSIVNAAAGVSEVYILGTPTAVPDAGSGYFQWITPDNGVGLSAAIPFTAFAAGGATLAAYIQNITNFDGEVTVTLAWPNLTFTFGGAYQNKALNTRGYALLFVPGTLLAGAVHVNGQMGISVVGVDGISAGTYTLDVYANVSGVVSILPDGSMKAYNS